MTAIEQIIAHINNKRSFVLEAGAGSGKTYTLIQTLHYIIDNYVNRLKESNQLIVCITYTNVAKNEINGRIENNDLVRVSTIHEFLWDTIKPFQKQLKFELCKLNELYLQKDVDKGKSDSRYIPNLSERIDLIESVSYNDTSFNDFESALIEHDDVIEMAKLMYKSYPLLTDVIADKYPFIFVDEYQDTAPETIHCLIDYLLNRNSKKVVLGFYGDSHQKIYNYGVGDLEKYYVSNDGPIELVKKEENYRSLISIVNLLNNFRKNIQQIPQTEQMGDVKFYYWKSHPEKPKTRITQFNAEISILKNKFYDGLVKTLSNAGWSFGANSEDRILVLANSRVAQRAGFRDLYSIFSRRFALSTKERLLDRNHVLINFFVGSIDKKTSQERKTGLEHLLKYWSENNQNDVLRFIRKNGTLLSGEFKHSHKKLISEQLNFISNLRKTGTIKEVFDSVTSIGLINNTRLNEFIEKVNLDPETIGVDERDRQQRDKVLLETFMNLPYTELLNFWEHIQKNTVFSTKHGTKGDEFRNVLAVIDDTEWPQEYNFKKFFNGTEEDPNRLLRTRNLFYVECSRAIENLNILCLSDLDRPALVNIESWFGSENVIPIEDYLKS